MAGELGGVSPLQNFGPQDFLHVQAVGWTSTGTRLTLGGSPHPLLNAPGEGGNDTGRRKKDGSRPLSRFFFLLKLLGQSIRFGVMGPQTIRESEVEVVEEKGPMGPARVKSLGSVDVFAVYRSRSKPRMVLWDPPTNVTILLGPSSPPANVCCQCHNFSQQETVAKRRRHRGGASGKTQIFGTGLLQLQHLRSPPPPQTDQGPVSGEWALR